MTTFELYNSGYGITIPDATEFLNTPQFEKALANNESITIITKELITRTIGQKFQCMTCSGTTFVEGPTSLYVACSGPCHTWWGKEETRTIKQETISAEQFQDRFFYLNPDQFRHRKEVDCTAPLTCPVCTRRGKRGKR